MFGIYCREARIPYDTKFWREKILANLNRIVKNFLSKIFSFENFVSYALRVYANQGARDSVKNSVQDRSYIIISKICKFVSNKRCVIRSVTCDHMICMFFRTLIHKNLRKNL